MLGRRLLRRFIEKHEAIKMEFWDGIKYEKKKIFERISNALL